jgi:hypothetical protein
VSEHQGIEVEPGEWGELKATTPHEAYASAILMYAFAVFVVAVLAIFLVWLARWAL